MKAIDILLGSEEIYPLAHHGLALLFWIVIATDWDLNWTVWTFTKSLAKGPEYWKKFSQLTRIKRHCSYIELSILKVLLVLWNCDSTFFLEYNLIEMNIQKDLINRICCSNFSCSAQIRELIKGFSCKNKFGHEKKICGLIRNT